ncbi:hypothetical protein BASA83_003692 [Batrachochytrium salamandrivorans]|nr:hypothetical protein BASA83_003692 [Batrachochytrium salamandrivorans]
MRSLQPQQMPEPAPSIIQFSPVADVFSVTNLLHDTLEYEILTDGVYFSMELVDSGLLLMLRTWTTLGSSVRQHLWVILCAISYSNYSPSASWVPRPLWTSTGLLSLGPMQSQQLRIVPLMDAISKNVETLKKVHVAHIVIV